jgi:hypothetical protein
MGQALVLLLDRRIAVGEPLKFIGVGTNSPKRAR